MASILLVLIVAVVFVTGVESGRMKRSVPTVTVSPTSTIIGCSATQNAALSTRTSTFYTCNELLSWSLYLASNPLKCNRTGSGSCTASTYNTGNCNTNSTSKTTHVNSLYLEFTYGTYTVVATNGIPYTTYVDNGKSANSVCEKYVVMLIRTSVQTTTPAYNYNDTNMGIIGIMRSGALLYNHKSAETVCNAAAISESSTFDSCYGHSDNSCGYHDHRMSPSSCYTYTNVSCSILGYLLDGYPIYSECSTQSSCYGLKNSSTATSTYTNERGQTISVYNGCDTGDYEYKTTSYTAGSCSLDKANGRLYNGYYGYFFTSSYPFVPPYFVGTSTKACLIQLS